MAGADINEIVRKIFVLFLQYFGQNMNGVSVTLHCISFYPEKSHGCVLHGIAVTEKHTPGCNIVLGRD